ncbi:PI-PLC X domain-containing protein 2 isoform X2 [Corythoichthys intestinalis]|uniref:PI-PLC X domain-containing protein 2 isoform X2 n=1 Tax=Corythoichthys intestinalis TaxID=161448 RepID=UPI0025A5B2A1|nr:PI-PLC X domain-containing protein 2 isoform X2 [Corythoichthys intestinalis]
MKTRPAGIGNVNADWMGSLPPKLCVMPLKHLAIPGSHDSFTYWVDVHAPVGPDQKVYVKYLATMFSVLAKKVMVKWSMTQNLTFKEQLDAGIRYFDLRVSSKPGEPGLEIFFIHGLFGHKVRDGLREINAFLCEHRTEVIFLDFNHYYKMSSQHHEYLIKMLQEVFGNKLCKNCDVETITLDYLWKSKYQVKASLPCGLAARSPHHGQTPLNPASSSRSVFQFSGNHTEAKSQEGFVPRVPSHPHTSGQHCGKRTGLGATELFGGKKSPSHHVLGGGPEARIGWRQHYHF